VAASAASLAGLLGPGTESVSVADSFDLSAALLRAGRARPSYDAAVVLTAVDPAVESLVVQVRDFRRVLVGERAVAGR